MTRIHNFKLVSDGPFASDTKVYLDGKEITGSVLKCTLVFEAEEANKVLLELIPDSIDLQTQAEVN